MWEFVCVDEILMVKFLWFRKIKFVYVIAWLAVVFGINSTSNAGVIAEAKPSAIYCIISAINPKYHS